MGYEVEFRGATEAEAQTFAEEFLDSMVGFRVPRDAEPAWVLKCPTNGRYFYRTTPQAGPLTVARHHAHRFSTKADAIAAMHACRLSGKAPFKVVRICLANPLREEKK